MCLYTSICIEVRNSLQSFIVDDIGDDSESEIPDEVCNEEDIFFDSEGEDDDENYMHTSDQGLSPVMRSLLLFLMLWQIIFNVSDAGMYAL